MTAILMARNAAVTLPRLLDHMAANRIPVIFIDHGSTDATREIVGDRQGSAVAEVISEPFRGVFDLTRQLELKREIIKGVSADWIVHLDADEFLLPAQSSETLRGFLDRNADAPVEAISCDEYVFLPRSEADRHVSATFLETMTACVRFENRDPKQRVFRKKADLRHWLRTGGHFVSGNALDEPLVLHHYIGLSLDHLRSQYIGRVYSPADLAKGWHFNRRAMSADFITAPNAQALAERRGEGEAGGRRVRHLPVFARRGFVKLPRPTLIDVDLVLACDMPAGLAKAEEAIRHVLPAARLARLHQPVEGLPVDVPLLHVIVDGRRWIAGDPGGGRARELAGRWCRFVAALRQEGLRLRRYAELRLEDIETGEADLPEILNLLFRSDGENPPSFSGFAVRPPPAALPGEEVEAFEAIAGPLLRDLGFGPARLPAVFASARCALPSDRLGAQPP